MKVLRLLCYLRPRFFSNGRFGRYILSTCSKCGCGVSGCPFPAAPRGSLLPLTCSKKRLWVINIFVQRDAKVFYLQKLWMTSPGSTCELNTENKRARQKVRDEAREYRAVLRGRAVFRGKVLAESRAKKALYV